MSGLNNEEQAFMEEAVELARKLGRPFGEKEILANALREGYELKLAFDPRFKRVSPRQGNTPAQWILDENPERLKVEAITDFFGAMKLYAMRCVSLADSYEKEILRGEAHLPYARRKHTKRELIKESLQSQGWDVDDEELIKQICLKQ